MSHLLVPDPRVPAALRRQLRARQAALEDGADSVGWKLGGDVAEIDALTGSAPVIGSLTTASLVPVAGIYDAPRPRALRAETELVIELATPDSVAGVGVAIEIIDVARPPETMKSIVAANVSHRAAVLGEARAAAVEPYAVARLWVNGSLCEAAPAATDVQAEIDGLGRLAVTIAP